MLRRGLLLAAPALVATRAAASTRLLRPDDARPPQGKDRALLWLHAHYSGEAPPDPPTFADRLLDQGWDLWRFERPPSADAAQDRFGASDPIGAGIRGLQEACRSLGGRYRTLAVLGESRGAFIALAALHTGLQADALLAIAPAAHGTRVERRPQALADFEAAMHGCVAGRLKRLGLVLFAEDPYDPDPAARARSFLAAARNCRVTPLLIDQPPQPRGHGAVRDPAFDRLLGERLASFLAG